MYFKNVGLSCKSFLDSYAYSSLLNSFWEPFKASWLGFACFVRYSLNSTRDWERALERERGWGQMNNQVWHWKVYPRVSLSPLGSKESCWGALSKHLISIVRTTAAVFGPCIFPHLHTFYTTFKSKSTELKTGPKVPKSSQKSQKSPQKVPKSPQKVPKKSLKSPQQVPKKSPKS